MKNLTADELRDTYLKFFESKGHKIIPGASVIPENDPTVLFTTAGMHPLVPYLMGAMEHPAGTRLTDVQKCVRTGDIDEVGDAAHLTFFEMLGNWSLNDYFKKEAISWSFEFLTQHLGFKPEQLNVTVFRGEGQEGEAGYIPADEEAVAIWKSLGIPDERIFRLPRDCFEEADVLSDILQKKRYTKSELAAKLGISVAALENKLCLCKVAAEQRQLLLAAEISPRHCILFSKQSQETQNKIMTELQIEKARGERAQAIVESYCTETSKNRKFALHDTLPFFNTIEKAVSTMRKAGVEVRYERTERQADVFLAISVPR